MPQMFKLAKHFPQKILSHYYDKRDNNIKGKDDRTINITKKNHLSYVSFFKQNITKKRLQSSFSKHFPSEFKKKKEREKRLPCQTKANNENEWGTKKVDGGSSVKSFEEIIRKSSDSVSFASRPHKLVAISICFKLLILSVYKHREKKLITKYTKKLEVGSKKISIKKRGTSHLSPQSSSLFSSHH